jgi:4-amino-4-deoxy-L-arabinose transferase-like glycosyltransferase
MAMTSLLHGNLKTILILFIASFAVKAGLILLIHLPQLEALEDRYDTTLQDARYDDREYIELSRRLAEFQTYSFHCGNPEKKSVYRTPGYTTILAGIGILTQWNILGMLLLQAFCLSVIPLILLQILGHLNLPRWPAWLAVLDPLVIILSTTFMVEGWMILLLSLSLWGWVRSENFNWRLLTFVAFGLAILVKPTIQYFYVLLAVLALVFMKRRWLTVATLLVGLIPVLLWMGRNHSVTGQFIISTQKDNAVLLVPILDEEMSLKRIANDYRDQFDPELRDHHHGHVMGLIRDNKLDFTDLAKETILEHPVTFLKFHTLGCFHVLFGTAQEHIRQTYFLGRDMPPPINLILNVLIVGYYFLLYLLIAQGIRFRNIKSPVWILCTLFCLYNIGIIGILAFNTGGGLKRSPFVPHLIILSAMSAAALPDTWSRIKRLCAKRAD